MSAINASKVVTGGLLAGLVMNIGEYILNEVILAERWQAATAGLNMPEPGTWLIIFFIIWSFVFGIAMIYLYAAFRPRCGAGPKTAVCAGITAWFFTSLMGFGPTAIMGLFPADLVVISLIWGLVEMSLAALAGARFYTE